MNNNIQHSRVPKDEDYQDTIIVLNNQNLWVIVFNLAKAVRFITSGAFDFTSDSKMTIKFVFQFFIATE